MNRDIEIIHKYFDGDMTAAEKEAFLKRLSSEPELKKSSTPFPGRFASLRRARDPPFPFRLPETS